MIKNNVKMEDEHDSTKSTYPNTPEPAKENIVVAIRIRPLVGIESNFSTQSAIEVIEPHTKLRINNASMASALECSFNHIFTADSTQIEVFAFVEPITKQVIKGLNATIFAYGQTGTGKTHTMFGEGFDDLEQLKRSLHSRKDVAVPPNWGIIPRCFCQILNEVKDSAHLNVTIECSYIQIYNDKLYDLMRDRKRQRPLQLRETSVNGASNVYVQGLSVAKIDSLEDSFNVLRKGILNRAVRETEGNAQSSRSHAILQIFLTIEDKKNSDHVLKRTSKLNLVDLAGSEKWNTDLQMEGSHALELKNINTSLSALGNCIAALTQSGRKHIPYRDSTLTRLLQDSLGGNTKTVLIATISSYTSATEETFRTLQFADRAKSVMQTVYVNEEINGSKRLAVANNEIAILKFQLSQLKASKNSSEGGELKVSSLIASLESEVELKQEKIDALFSENKKYHEMVKSDEERISNLEVKVQMLQDLLACSQTIESSTESSQSSERIQSTINTKSSVSPLIGNYNDAWENDAIQIEHNRIPCDNLEKNLNSNNMYLESNATENDFVLPEVIQSNNQDDLDDHEETKDFEKASEQHLHENNYESYDNLLHKFGKSNAPQVETTTKCTTNSSFPHAINYINNDSRSIPSKMDDELDVKTSNANIDEESKNYKEKIECSLHKLPGCVLCKIRANDCYSKPRNMQSSTLALENKFPNADRRSNPSRKVECQQHSLTGCILCSKINGLNLDMEMALPERNNQRESNKTFLTKYARLYKQDQAPSGHFPEIERCSKHSLSNCILCKNSLTSLPKSSCQTTNGKESIPYDNPKRHTQSSNSILSPYIHDPCKQLSPKVAKVRTTHEDIYCSKIRYQSCNQLNDSEFSAKSSNARSPVAKKDKSNYKPKEVVPSLGEKKAKFSSKGKIMRKKYIPKNKSQLSKDALAAASVILDKMR